MCNLCSSVENERIAEIRSLSEMAERLNKLSCHLDNLASGRVKPHSKEAADIGATARSVIRYLVEEWV